MIRFQVYPIVEYSAGTTAKGRVPQCSPAVFFRLRRTLAGARAGPQEAICPVAAAQLPASALNDKFTAADDRLRDLVPRGFTYFRGSCPGDVHLTGAFTVCEPLVVDKPQCFILVHREDDRLRFQTVRRAGSLLRRTAPLAAVRTARLGIRCKPVDGRGFTDPSASLWSGHWGLPLIRDKKGIKVKDHIP